jgi:hypothetical protein
MYLYDAASRPPLVGEQKESQAERQLLMGICDKTVLEEDKYRSWEQKRHSEGGYLEFQDDVLDTFIHQTFCAQYSA